MCFPGLICGTFLCRGWCRCCDRNVKKYIVPVDDKCNVTFTDDNAILLSWIALLLSNLAYSSPLVHPERKDVWDKWIEVMDIDKIKSFYAQSEIGDSKNFGGGCAISGIIKTNDIKQLPFITFRGTASISDQLSDITSLALTDFITSKNTKLGQVPFGTYHQYCRIKKSSPSFIEDLVEVAKNNAMKLLVAGHSLGGMMASLAALELAVDYNLSVFFITIGGGRTFDRQHARDFERLANIKSFRFVNEKDLIPCLEFSNCNHVGQPVYLYNSNSEKKAVLIDPNNCFDWSPPIDEISTNIDTFSLDRVKWLGNFIKSKAAAHMTRSEDGYINSFLRLKEFQSSILKLEEPLKKHFQGTIDYAKIILQQSKT